VGAGRLNDDWRYAVDDETDQTDEMSETDHRSDQKLWPLFVIALALGAVGYVTALSNPNPDLGQEQSYSAEWGAETDVGEPSEESGPVDLAYRSGGERRLQIGFRQADTSGEHDVETRIDLEVAEKRHQRPEADGVRLERTYEKVGVSIRENERSIGPKIAAQMESLLLGSREILEVDPIGKPQEREWESVTNPQVRQTLRILRHATLLVMPRPRRGEVNPGDEWSYRLPAEIVDSSNTKQLEGEVGVREHYRGTVERQGRRLAVIERSFDLGASGQIRPRHDADFRSFDLVGEGTGRVLFDPEAGAVVESRLEVSRSLEIEGSDRQAGPRKGTIRIRLREAPSGDAS
jgi:hypothetical protein